MRQVIKDRLARIDVEIAMWQERYKILVTQEQKLGRKILIGGSKSCETQIQALLDRRNEIENKYLLEPVKRSAYERGLEDRQFNYTNACAEQAEYARQLAELVQYNSSDVAEIEKLRRQVTGMNRIIAVYKNSLDFWIAKKVRSRIVEDTTTIRRTTDVQTERALVQARDEVAADPEILALMKQREQAEELKYKLPDTGTSIDMLTRPEEKESLNDFLFDNSGIMNQPQQTKIVIKVETQEQESKGDINESTKGIIVE